MIVAKKGNITKKFTKVSWDLLGEKKNGWVEVTTPVVDNTAKEKTPPPTGETKKKEEKPVTVENTAGAGETKPEETVVDNTAKETPEAETETEFTKLAKASLTKAQIKDYLDAKELTYKSNAGLDVLIEMLSTLFNGDVEKLKTEFSI